VLAAKIFISATRGLADPYFCSGGDFIASSNRTLIADAHDVESEVHKLLPLISKARNGISDDGCQGSHLVRLNLQYSSARVMLEIAGVHRIQIHSDLIQKRNDLLGLIFFVLIICFPRIVIVLFLAVFFVDVSLLRFVVCSSLYSAKSCF
jgi:hypothetical protein